jgi:hypothetical protein
MTSLPLTQTAIAGIGETDYSSNSGRSELRLAAEASLAAIRDAGLTPADIDGMVTFTMDFNDELELQRSLGIPGLNWTSRTPFGGNGANATLQLAAAAVASGAAQAVLIYRAFNERSGRRFGTPESHAGFGMGAKKYDFHYTLAFNTAAKSYAMEFQSYAQRYGVTSEDLGRYVVQARDWASTNPRATYFEKPLTLRRASGVPLDRRAPPAAVGLLPGDGRGRCDRGDLARSGARPSPACGAHSRGDPAPRHPQPHHLRRLSHGRGEGRRGGGHERGAASPERDPPARGRPGDDL